MRQIFEERDNRSKCSNVRGRGTIAKRGDVDVATVGYNQKIFKAMHRADGKTTCEVGGGPFVLVDGEGTAPRGRQRVNRRRGEGGKGVRGGGIYPGGEGGE